MTFLKNTGTMFAIAAVCALSLAGPAAASSPEVNACIDSCFNTYSCAYQESQGANGYVCQNGRDLCVAGCSSASASRASGGAYGAIAYDKRSGAWGMSDESPDKQSAKRSALGYCGQHGPDCDVVDTFSKTCAAIASDNGAIVTWGEDDNADEAKRQALKSCARKAENSCAVRMSHCFYP